MRKSAEATLDALGDATGWISASYRNSSGQLNISIDVSSDWSGTVALDRTEDKGVTYNTLMSFTSDKETAMTDQVPGVWYRLRCSVHSAGECIAKLYK